MAVQNLLDGRHVTFDDVLHLRERQSQQKAEVCDAGRYNRNVNKKRKKIQERRQKSYNWSRCRGNAAVKLLIKLSDRVCRYLGLTLELEQLFLHSARQNIIRTVPRLVVVVWVMIYIKMEKLVL